MGRRVVITTEQKKGTWSVLRNPLTPEYLAWKAKVLGTYFPWYYTEGTLTEVADPNISDMPLYSHILLDRPERRERNEPSFAYPQALEVIQQICQHNDFRVWPFRMCLNSTRFSDTKYSPPHQDHEFPHLNMLIYLTKFSGGHTWVNGERCESPDEDKIIVFDGDQDHWLESVGHPSDRRVVLVMTFEKIGA